MAIEKAVKSRNRHWFYPLLIGLCAGLFGLGIGMNGWLQEFEWKTFDLRMRLLQKESRPPEDIVVILVDEASLRLMNPLVGRWPWPRSLHADLLDFLTMAGARSVAFDILFTENERAMDGSGLAEGDLRLVESVANAKMVSSGVQFVQDIEDEYNRNLLNKALPASFVQRFSLPQNALSRSITEAYNNAYLPFPQLAEVTQQIGITEFAPDSDGVYRHARLLGRYGSDDFPALSLSLLLNDFRPSLQSARQLALQPLPPKRGAEIIIPLLEDGSYLVKPYDNFTTYSIGGVLASIQKIMRGELGNLPVAPEEFHDKIVFIGASAVGVEDLKPLPFGNLAPGVFLHGSILGNILQRDFFTCVPRALQVLVVLLSALAVAGSILIPNRTSIRMMSAPLFILLLLATSAVLFKENIVLELTASLIGMLSAWLGSITYLSLTEGREKRRVRRMLGQYVSPAVLNTVLESSSSEAIQAEVGSRENLTILFSDIRGFTSLSEALPAETIVEILNGYFKEMVEIIFDQEGTLDKFIGDAIMAFWGAPLRINDHALKAVEAALTMMGRLETYNLGLTRKGLTPLDIGIGLHTGEVILGNIGSEQKLDYTIIGDNVNLGSRLEGLTKTYGAKIIVSETTWQQVEKKVRGRILDVVRVKGKEKPIAIYQVFGLRAEGSAVDTEWETLAKLGEEGFRKYLAADWDQAKSAFEQTLQKIPGDRQAKIFLERITRYQLQPPAGDWDGVWTMQSK